MIFELLINFCILFTFAVLSYWPFQDSVRSSFPFQKAHPYLIGIMAGFAGFMLMESAVHVTDTIFVDAKHVIVVFAGILGGPIAPVISGLLIGISRILMPDVLTANDILAGVNIIVIGIVLGAFGFRHPMTLKNAHRYFYYATAQCALIFGVVIYNSVINYIQVVYFVLFAIFSFYTVLFILMELTEHFKKIRHTELLSETDYLTGLFNNRKFHQLTETFITDSTQPFSMISIDIDQFKKVNERYGHQVGDEILKELGLRLKSLVSIEDGYVTRNGGEEFVVLLPNSPPAMGIDLGERIRSSVARSPVRVSGDLDVSITVSAGVSSYPDNGLTIHDLYNAADMALLEAKATGRNRVVHYNNQKA
ncbi:diguanylate cyclase [Paenisporosarcina indica]|uniref:diguanylate cyclase n=1 Tax=Paenisporosarcina indica TaxID=650093 RepID=UPI00094F4BE1|nr:diguanylate cyclase [Paenisporosarcina indica]